MHVFYTQVYTHLHTHIYACVYTHVYTHFTHMFMHVFMHMSIQYRRLNLVKVCMSTPVSIHVYRHVSSIYACLLTCLHTCLAPSSSSGLAHFPTLLQPADTTQPGGCLATGHSFNAAAPDTHVCAPSANVRAPTDMMLF